MTSGNNTETPVEAVQGWGGGREPQYPETVTASENFIILVVLFYLSISFHIYQSGLPVTNRN